MADDELDALDALEKEATEFNKVRYPTTAKSIYTYTKGLSGCRDRPYVYPPPSTIHRASLAHHHFPTTGILKAFKLDAYASPPSPALLSPTPN